MGRYANDEFRSLKNDMLDMVDDLTNSQRDIAFVYDYQLKQAKLMTKRIENNPDEWKFQLKYSARFASKCIDET